MLRDTDARNPSYTGPEYDMALASAYLLVSARLPASRAFLTSDLTITAGASSAALASTVTQWTGGVSGGREYAGDVQIKNQTTGEFLTKLTWEEIQQWRTGVATLPTARPLRFALLESKAQAVTAYFECLSDRTYTCDVIAPLMADSLLDYVGSGSDDADDVSLQMSRLGVEAVQYLAASDLVVRMIDEDLRERRLNPSIADKWRRDGERCLYKEGERRHNIEDAGRIQRWQS